MCSSMADRVRECTPLGLFGTLPDAVVSVILFGLNSNSLAVLGCCSRHLLVWCQQEVIWQHQAVVGHSGPVQFKVSQLIHCQLYTQPFCKACYAAAQQHGGFQCNSASYCSYCCRGHGGRQHSGCCYRRTAHNYSSSLTLSSPL